MSTASACRAATAAPAWRRSWSPTTSTSTALREHLAAAAAGLCAAGVPAHPPGHRHDRHLQAEEGRSGEAGLRSGRDRRSDLFQRSRRQGLRAARRAAVRADLRRRDSVCDDVRNRRRRARVLARRRPEEMVHQGRRLRRRDRARFLATYEAAAAGKLSRLGGDAGGRARAGDRARPVSAQHVPRRRAHLRGRSDRARASPTARSRAASTSRSPATSAMFFYLPFEHSESDGRPGALLRAVPRASATPTCCNGPSCTPTSSAASAAFRIATRCSAATTTPEEQAFLDSDGFAG